MTGLTRGYNRPAVVSVLGVILKIRLRHGYSAGGRDLANELDGETQA
ncbi:hypothetical protein QFZ79_003099 [Arthrobacter sp. V4I6]|nr:hypothetical protein [Arthrobacter sp. V1I7]MDQ0854988.1 hypothetical protein [Arthrobacter sp. V4I6]